MRRQQESAFSTSNRVHRTMCHSSRGIRDARRAFGEVIGQVPPHQPVRMRMFLRSIRILNVGAVRGYSTEIVIFRTRSGSPLADKPAEFYSSSIGKFMRATRFSSNSRANLIPSSICCSDTGRLKSSSTIRLVCLIIVGRSKVVISPLART